MDDPIEEDDHDKYDWEWIQQVAGKDGIGNYPASREALYWCVEEIKRLREAE